MIPASLPAPGREGDRGLVNLVPFWSSPWDVGPLPPPSRARRALCWQASRTHAARPQQRHAPLAPPPTAAAEIPPAPSLSLSCFPPLPVDQALEKYNIEKDIAAFIKKEFDKKYNPTWHCIVGRNFGAPGARNPTGERGPVLGKWRTTNFPWVPPPRPTLPPAPRSAAPSLRPRRGARGIGARAEDRQGTPRRGGSPLPPEN